MAQFQFSNNRTIDLDFCGKIRKQLVVNTDLMKRVQAASEYLTSKDADVKNTSDPAVVDAMCDYVMDAIDMILGDGEADKILELNQNYTVFDVIDVFMYIFSEITSITEGLSSVYSAQLQNRAQRRAAGRM